MPRHLAVTIYQQETAFSCVAAITQTVHEFHTGTQLSHEDAILLTGCKFDGAELVTVAKVMKKLHGTRYRSLQSLRSAKCELKKGNLVVSNDDRSYVDPHAVLFVGATNSGVYVLDPNTALIKWRKDSFVRASGANEFIAIFPPAKLQHAVNRLENVGKPPEQVSIPACNGQGRG